MCVRGPKCNLFASPSRCSIAVHHHSKQRRLFSGVQRRHVHVMNNPFPTYHLLRWPVLRRHVLRTLRRLRSMPDACRRLRKVATAQHGVSAMMPDTIDAARRRSSSYHVLRYTEANDRPRTEDNDRQTSAAPRGRPTLRDTISSSRAAGPSRLAWLPGLGLPSFPWRRVAPCGTDHSRCENTCKHLCLGCGARIWCRESDEKKSKTEEFHVDFRPLLPPTLFTIDDSQEKDNFDAQSTREKERPSESRTTSMFFFVLGNSISLIIQTPTTHLTAVQQTAHRSARTGKPERHVALPKNGTEKKPTNTALTTGQNGKTSYDHKHQNKNALP